MRKGSISGEEGHLAPSRGSERLAFRVGSILLCPEVLSSFPGHAEATPDPGARGRPLARSPCPPRHGSHVGAPAWPVPACGSGRAIPDSPSQSSPGRPPATLRWNRASARASHCPSQRHPADLGLPETSAGALRRLERTEKTHRATIKKSATLPEPKGHGHPDSVRNSSLQAPSGSDWVMRRTSVEKRENTAQGTGRPSHDPPWGCARTGATGLGQH